MTRILVIEDETAVRENVIEILELEGYETTGVENGQEGIRAAFSESFDLVICDIMMPVMDGFSVLMHLRQNPVTVSLPVIFLTAKTERISQRHGMDVGADDYITKPFTRMELIKSVKSRLSRNAELDRTFNKKIQAIQEKAVFQMPVEFASPLSNILELADALTLVRAGDPTYSVNEIGKEIHRSARLLMDITQKYLFLADLQERDRAGGASGSILKVENPHLIILEILCDRFNEFGIPLPKGKLDVFDCPLSEEDLCKLIEFIAVSLILDSAKSSQISVSGKLDPDTLEYQLQFKYQAKELVNTDRLTAPFHHHTRDREWMILKQTASLLNCRILFNDYRDHKEVIVYFPTKYAGER